mmetsp:Transcript_23500/g.81822  ORF Transcript_23500/g.81822 Transcript_23500/m.81822 type:complete len:340 (-) Transcript_23500:53-1072(-)
MPAGACVVVGLAAVAAVVASIPAGIFFVEEGSVGVVYFGGALTDSLLTPGYHWTPPLVTRRELVTTRMQTSTVRNVACGSKSGVMLNFDSIEVVHRLDKSNVLRTLREYGPRYEKTWVRDRLRSEVNQICSSMTLSQITVEEFDHVDDIIKANLETALANFQVGVEIQAVRVTKPQVPDVVRVNYERVEAERARHKFVVQAQERELKEAETAAAAAVLRAKKEKEVAVIDAKRRVDTAAGAQEVARIEDKMVAARGKSEGDARRYAIEQQAESEARLLSPRYLEYLRAKTQFRNTRMYIGDSVPDAIIEESEGGGGGGGGGGASTTTLHSAHQAYQGSQ